MKTITNPLKTRQIQPIDFSFLSLADKEIVLAVEAMLRTMYNFPDNIPIILQGLEYSQDSFTISGGKVLFSGIVYDVEQLYLATSDTITTSNVLSFVSLILQQRVTSPSPVLDKNLSATINCHYEHYGTLSLLSRSVSTDNFSPFSNNSGRPTSNTFDFNSLLRVEPITSLASQATALQLQQLSDQLTTINTSLSSLRHQLTLERTSRQSDIDGIKYILNAIVHQYSGTSAVYQLIDVWEHVFSTEDWNNHIYNNNANTDNQ